MADIPSMNLSENRSGDFDDESLFSPFDIPSTKHASTARLKRWRKAALVLNSSRRFRYTLDLKKLEERKQREIRSAREAQAQAMLSARMNLEKGEGDHHGQATKKIIRARGQVIRAALLFKQLADEQVMTGTASSLLQRFGEQWISHSNRELEASSCRDSTGGFDKHKSLSGPFDIVSTKRASIDTLKHWRESTLVLNPSRRFRYTLDLKKQEKKEQTLKKIRSARAQGMPPEMYLKREAENGRAIVKIRAYICT